MKKIVARILNFLLRYWKKMALHLVWITVCIILVKNYRSFAYWGGWFSGFIVALAILSTIGRRQFKKAGDRMQKVINDNKK